MWDNWVQSSVPQHMGGDRLCWIFSGAINGANLLGAPLFSKGLNTYLGLQCKTLQILSQRLLLMSGHEDFLFKNCLTIPKWLHLLRSSPCLKSSDLQLDHTLQCELVACGQVQHSQYTSYGRVLGAGLTSGSLGRSGSGFNHYPVLS